MIFFSTFFPLYKMWNWHFFPSRQQDSAKNSSFISIFFFVLSFQLGCFFPIFHGPIPFISPDNCEIFRNWKENQKRSDGDWSLVFYVWTGTWLRELDFKCEICVTIYRIIYIEREENRTNFILVDTWKTLLRVENSFILTTQRIFYRKEQL